MLKANIDADVFKESIDVILALVTECRVHTENEGILTRAVDTANVAMVTLTLDKSAFSSYEASADQIGVDITKMKNIIGMMNKGEPLTLDLPEGEKKLKLSFGGYRYSITLLDVNTIRKDPNPPTIELPGKAVLSGDDLNSAIKAAAVISDKVALGIDPETETFYMEAEGDTDHIKLEIGSGDLRSLTPVKVRSLFSLDYLKDMGRVMGRADEVEIQLGNDHPVKFGFDIANGGGHVEYLLAPRIEAE